jgi:hypothetical protein
MQIAVIGWGSLIWCPGCLQIKSRWRSDGPALPVEFARISSDKRLTLVIHTGTLEEPTPDQQTYWALSEFEDVERAQENLRVREGTSAKHMAAEGQQGGEIDPEISARIRKWLQGQPDVQAAVWTALPSNWLEQRGEQFTTEDAVAYLRELESKRDQAKVTYDRAHEYVTNAPSQIQTPVRKMVGQEKGWEAAKLPSVLFESAEGDS